MAGNEGYSYKDFCHYVETYGLKVARQILSIEWQEWQEKGSKRAVNKYQRRIDDLIGISPGQEQFLECIANTIRMIHLNPSHPKKGAILVFLPGLQEITMLW